MLRVLTSNIHLALAHECDKFYVSEKKLWDNFFIPYWPAFFQFYLNTEENYEDNRNRDILALK